MSAHSPELLQHAQQTLEAISTALKATLERPHGLGCDPQTQQEAADACIQLCSGDRNHARGLWKQIAADCNGYMPHAAAVALIRASKPELQLDVPEVT